MTKTQQVTTKEMPPIEVPAQIQNGFAMVNFVRAILERDKKDNAFIIYEISFGITEEHAEADAKGRIFIPKKVKRVWEAMNQLDLKSCEILDIPPQAVTFAIAPDMGDDKSSLVLEGSNIEQMKLRLITEKGTGKARKYVRLSCQIRIPAGESSISFARKHFGRKIWLDWEQAQKEFFTN